MTTKTMYGYRLIATHRGVDCTDDALDGADRHARFVTRFAAEAEASALQDEAAECGFDPAPVYAAEECAVIISDVQYHDAEGVVTAGITDVWSGEETDVVFGVNPNYTERGIDGLLAAGELGLGAGRRWDSEVAAAILTLVRVTEWDIEAAQEAS